MHTPDRPPIESRAPGQDGAPAGSERRSRLRQYQVQLLERMQAAKNGAVVSGRELGLIVGGRLCLLDLTQISEIVTLPAITPVPLARDWYLGLANIRGNLTGVVDLALYQGESGAAAGAGVANNPGERRLITFAPRLGFNCALLAERVLGLRNLTEMEAVPQEPGHPSGGWCGQQFQDREAQRWTRLDLTQLVRETRFLQVGLVA